MYSFQVTGSGRGLGRSIAQSLAKEGAKVICVDINEKNNHETAQLIKDEGGLAAAYTVNVAKVEQVMELAKTIEIEHGPVDILVNNAALVMGMTVAEWDPAEIIASYNVNVLSLYWMVMAFLPSMRKRNDGHIVAISSISALAPTICLSIYGATKAAVSSRSYNLNSYCT
ncbi:hypothetical protein AAG570_008762 [Ranatra chinensis]|uniref:Uncharacterized protein n=1 Tax=Ranatra chinensis TaxID=642074 RepID=A0ABD0YS51_9HEMI